jgi:hypothetical protein
MAARDVVIAFRAAVVADAFRAPDAQARADALHQVVSAIPLQGPAGDPLAAAAFDIMVQQIELLPSERVFEAAMLAGEVLAACALASPPHAAFLQRWTARTHQGPRLAAMRACSKLCEYDTTLVDDAMLRSLAERDDVDETTLGYLAQVAGRLRGEEKGEALIELLGNQDASRRILAAHAITYSVAVDPPFAKLTAFARFGPSRLVSGPPSRRLLRLFAALLADSAGEVATAAAQAAQVAYHVWPDMSKAIADLQIELMGLPSAAPSADTAKNPRSIGFALQIPNLLGRRYGKLSWSPELLEEEREAAANGTALPRALDAPRLFLSYRWSDRPTDDLLIDEVAGGLHMRGYDLIFDRDPRYLDADRDAADVLSLMRECTHFVPVLNGELCRYLGQRRSGPKSALDLEWELARKLTRKADGLRWVTLWFDGERLPRALAARPRVDLRKSRKALDAVFPECMFVVRVFDAQGKKLHESARVDRRGLRAMYLKGLRRRGAARCEIHDVTRRRRLAALGAGS